MHPDTLKNLQSLVKLERDGVSRDQLDSMAQPKVRQLAEAHGGYENGLAAFELLRLLHNGTLKFEGSRLVMTAQS